MENSTDLQVLEGVTLNGQPIGFAAERVPAFIPDPYCFVCGRCTDHVGEHDELLAAGVAAYEDWGQVVLVTTRAAAVAVSWGFWHVAQGVSGERWPLVYHRGWL